MSKSLTVILISIIILLICLVILQFAFLEQSLKDGYEIEFNRIANSEYHQLILNNTTYYIFPNINITLKDEIDCKVKGKLNFTIQRN